MLFVNVYRCFDRFEKDKLNGIYELKGRGKKAVSSNRYAFSKTIGTY